MNPGPYSGSRVVGTHFKGRRREESGPRRRREVGESFGRKVSRRVSHDQKNYQNRQSFSSRRTDVDKLVEPRRGFIEIIIQS